jgi:hypothetical protein
MDTSVKVPGGSYKKVSTADEHDMDTVQINFHPPQSYPNYSNPNFNTNNNLNSSAQSNNASNNNASTEIDPAIPRIITYTRVINLGLSICMILISLLAILTTQSATTGVLACYVVVFACLLCCFETHLKQVSKIIALNFGFMYSAKSRAAFMIFIGTILFSFSLFGKILGLCMLANAGFNIYILWKYPSFDDIQRDNAQSEIKDFLRSNPAFGAAVVSAGATAIQSNPGKLVLWIHFLLLFFLSHIVFFFFVQNSLNRE